MKHARFNSLLLYLAFFLSLTPAAVSLRFCNLQALTQFTTLPILGYKCCGCENYKPSYRISNNSEGVWARIYIIHGPFYSWNRECWRPLLTWATSETVHLKFTEDVWRAGLTLYVSFVLILRSHVSNLRLNALSFGIFPHIEDSCHLQ